MLIKVIIIWVMILKELQFFYKLLFPLILEIAVAVESLKTSQRKKAIPDVAVEDWLGRLKQVDDLCVIGLRV